MVDITADVPSCRTSPDRARQILAMLLALGLISLAAVLSQAQPDGPSCRGFTIGVSAIGGCDGIGGKPTPLALLRSLFQL